MLVRAIALACAACFATPTFGDIITFRFDGTVTGNNFSSGPWTDADVGDAYAFQYSFDTGAADSDPAVVAGEYLDCITAQTIFAGTAFETGPGSGDITLNNNANDSYFVVVDLAGGYQAWVLLSSSGGSGLSSDSLPTTLDLADWDVRAFTIEHTQGGRVSGNVTSFTVVPPPSAAAILGTAILRAGRRRREHFSVLPAETLRRAPGIR